MKFANRQHFLSIFPDSDFRQKFDNVDHQNRLISARLAKWFLNFVIVRRFFSLTASLQPGGRAGAKFRPRGSRRGRAHRARARWSGARRRARWTLASSVTGGISKISKIGKFAKMLQIFGGLVLGCIKTKFCKKICVWQHFSISTRSACFCTAAI